ncbi:MAG: hypothetical protein JXN61_16300 [Sedimentisphaerales bacterium]|nr:hypothetical protein [Sedimentisphaerales bacterium]
MRAKARCRRLILFLLLSLAMAARGAQSVDDCGAPHLSDTLCCGSRADYPALSAFDRADDTCNTYLARIGKELLDPPAHAVEQNALPEGAKLLPGVPAAIFMVLTGFLCVSFVNDRRIWLAGLAGLLWLGQTGLSAIPQVACRLAGKINVTQDHNHNFAGAGSYRHRLRSDIEGSQYMGLLRHLAGIPTPSSCLMPESLLSPLTCQGSCCGAGPAHCARPEFAITPAAPGISNSTVCSACATEHYVRFSPAFAFSNLARGPPRSS